MKGLLRGHLQGLPMDQMIRPGIHPVNRKRRGSDTREYHGSKLEDLPQARYKDEHSQNLTGNYHARRCPRHRE